MNVQKLSVHNKNSKKGYLRKEWNRNKYLYILAIPIILYFAIFKYLPMFGLAIAFKDFSIAKGVFDSPWVGFRWFQDYFSSVYFSRTMLNTLIISILEILWGFPFPIIFALLLNEVHNNAFKKLVQTTSYLPHFISMVVICGMISDFCSTDGLIATLIAKLGGENMNYLADPKYFRTIFVASSVWHSFGWGSIIYLSALTNIDSQLYEAAVIDGAGKWKQMIHVTLPGIANTIIIMFIMRLGRILSVGYEKVILLYSPQTYEVADIISSYTYRVGILSGKYGYSAAVGLFQSVVNIIVLILSNAIAKKYNETSLF